MWFKWEIIIYVLGKSEFSRTHIKIMKKQKPFKNNSNFMYSLVKDDIYDS